MSNTLSGYRIEPEKILNYHSVYIDKQIYGIVNFVSLGLITFLGKDAKARNLNKVSPNMIKPRRESTLPAIMPRGVGTGGG